MQASSLHLGGPVSCIAVPAPIFLLIALPAVVGAEVPWGRSRGVARSPRLRGRELASRRQAPARESRHSSAEHRIFYWQRVSVAWEFASATDPPPETTVLGPLWIATTDAAGVTELLDRRVFAADTIVIPLRGDLPAAPGPISEALIAHDGLVLEDVIYRLSGNGGGTAGQTKLNLLLDGATLYPSAAQDDHRPAWPFDAAGLIVQGSVHELAELHPGQLLQLVSIEHPTGGTPARAEAYLLCRRP